jgi:hypothetical protein
MRGYAPRGEAVNHWLMRHVSVGQGRIFFAENCLIERKVPRAEPLSLIPINGRQAMTVETILVVIAVTMMFATIAAVIAWGDKQTRNL